MSYRRGTTRGAAVRDSIRLLPARARGRGGVSITERLRRFDAATARQREREKHMTLPAEAPAARDWTREDLY